MFRLPDLSDNCGRRAGRRHRRNDAGNVNRSGRSRRKILLGKSRQRRCRARNVRCHRHRVRFAGRDIEHRRDLSGRFDVRVKHAANHADQAGSFRAEAVAVPAA